MNDTLSLLIANALIVDGTGAPAYRGSVGVKDGRIAALGDVHQPAERVIDAGGQVVCPGFIDVHTHYDAQVFWDPALTPSSLHGVTTIFGGFCGFSIAPLDPASGDYLMHMLAHVEGIPVESLRAGVPWDWCSFGSYLDKIDGKLAVNTGFLAGHAAIRRWVMGDRAVGHKATAEEIEAMRQLLRDSIAQGAMGFSTSVSPTHCDGDGEPVPSRHASREEIMALAAVASEFEGTLVELIPGADFTDETYDILTDFSLAARRPMNWNAIGVQAPTPQVLARNAHNLGASDYARDKGAEVIALTIPMSATVRMNFRSGFILDAIPGWAELFKVPPAERISKLKDPAYRRQLQDHLTSPNVGVMGSLLNFERLKVDEAFSPDTKPSQGRMVAEIARAEGREPFDVMLDLALADDLKTSFMATVPEPTRETFIERAKLWRDQRTLIGASDAGAHLDSIDTFAFSTTLLQQGVREFAVVGLEEAVHMITAKSARKYGLRERGELKLGYHADLVIFDPDTIACGETYTRYDLPGGAGRLYADAHGISQVIVNGQVIAEHGELTGATPGRVFHPGRDTATVPLPLARSA